MDMENQIAETVLDSRLTPEQRAAANDPAREVLCIACAGSGKSRTLAYRIVRLINEGASPDSILAFTFTEKAAESIKRRVAEALRESGHPISMLGAMYIGTIHSYCQYLLGEMDAKYRQFDVLDENRLKLYLLSRYYSIPLAQIQAEKGAGQFTVIGEVADAWMTANDEMLSLTEIRDREPTLGEVLINLSTLLNNQQYIDFSLMIRLAVEAFRANDSSMNNAVSSLRHIMVDEYQDVNPAQEALIAELRRRAETLFVVGDDDQAIYAWRGADVNNILTFAQRYPNASQHTLSENFRSTQPIVEAANGFIVSVLSASRLDKSPFAHGFPEESCRDFRNLWFPSRQEEADWVADRINSLIGTRYVERDGTERGLTPADFAILMRSTKSGENAPRHFEFTEALKARNILYTIESAGGIFERPHARVLRETMELLREPAPTRSAVTAFFNERVIPTYPLANLNGLISVLSQWNLLIHTPPGGTRRKVYPQELIHELLNVYGIAQSNFNDVILRDLGVFSNIILDVEKVYVSIDSVGRYREILNFLQNVAESGYDVSTINLVTRPDAVTISTVHKMKGLEYPVVFIVDVINGRFPLSKKSYRGWIPQDLITSALQRGAYGTSKYDEARLFYTALTRAERFLYITGGELQPGLKNPKKRSDFSLRVSHNEVITVSEGLPVNHAPAPLRRRVEETEVPTSYTQIKDYLTCPYKYKLRQHYGFSPPVPEMFGFGLTTHTAIGKLHQRFSQSAPTPQQADEVARDTFHLKHAFPSRDPVNRPGGYENAMNRSAEIVQQYVSDFAQDFTRGKQVEARFEIKASRAVISGAIDLLLTEDEQGNLRAEVIDFKALSDPNEATDSMWTDLSLQVQLYAHAARNIFGENTESGAVHFLKENRRIQVPIDENAISSAISNVEWAVGRILEDDFPMRPSVAKCEGCDFKRLCAKRLQSFTTEVQPPPIHVPNSQPQMVPAFSNIAT